MKRAVFLLGSPTGAAVREGRTLTQYDFENLQMVSTKASLDAEIVFTVQSPEFQGKKKPGMTAIRAERDRVLKEIQGHNPDLVVCFGPEAVKCLWDAGNVKASEMRRGMFQLEGVTGDISVTYSLSEAAMKPNLIKWIALDIIAAATGKTECQLGDYPVQTEMHPDLKDWYMHSVAGATLALDLETYPSFDPWHSEARIRMAVVSHRTGWCQVVQATPDSKFPGWLVELIENPNIRKVGSNIKFDYRWLARFGVQMRNMGDTSTAEHVIDGNSPAKDLKSLTLQYHPTLGDYSAGHRKLVTERGGWEYITDEEMYEYAGGDGDASITIYNKQINVLTKKNRLQPYNLLMKTYQNLARMEVSGACIDRAENERLDKAYTEEISALTEKIQSYPEMGPINPNSPKQLMAALEAIPGINLMKPEVMRKLKWQFWKGEEDNEPEDTANSTSKAVLERESSKHPVIQDILDYRKRSKLHSTFVKKFATKLVREGANWFVRSTYRTDVTTTYRLASRDPNLTNTPRNMEAELAHLNIKSQYISRWREIGGTLAVFDLSQAELRCGAMISKDPALMAAFESGNDIHKQVASTMLNIPIGEVTPFQRTGCKTLNFLMFYGGGAAKLAESLGITKKAAQKLIDDYFARFHVLHDWMEQVKEDVLRTRTTSSRFGVVREFQMPPMWDKPAVWAMQRQAVNMPVQSEAAFFTFLGINNMFEEKDRLGLRSMPILTVHDSVNWDVYPGELDAVKEVAYNALQNPRSEEWGVPMTVPMVADGEFGTDWASAA